MNEDLVNIKEMAVLIGSSTQTITLWYRWKDINKTHELATLLPDYMQIGNRRTRYWNREDVDKLKKFKESIPRGRYGIMGEITQSLCIKKRANRVRLEV